MKIRIYINENDKIMCNILGEPKDIYLSNLLWE